MYQKLYNVSINVGLSKKVYTVERNEYILMSLIGRVEILLTESDSEGIQLGEFDSAFLRKCIHKTSGFSGF